MSRPQITERIAGGGPRLRRSGRPEALARRGQAARGAGAGAGAGAEPGAGAGRAARRWGRCVGGRVGVGCGGGRAAALLPRHSAGRGGEMRLLALAAAVLLARAPAPGKRVGTGRLGDPSGGARAAGAGEPGARGLGLAGRPCRLWAVPSRSPSASVGPGLVGQAAEHSGASQGSGMLRPFLAPRPAGTPALRGDPPQPGSLPGARPPSGRCEQNRASPSFGLFSVFFPTGSTDSCWQVSVGRNFPLTLFGEFLGGPGPKGPDLRRWRLGSEDLFAGVS